MELFVTIKSLYGKQVIYPACNASQAIARTGNKKTLTDTDIQILKGAGFTFTVKPQKLQI